MADLTALFSKNSLDHLRERWQTSALITVSSKMTQELQVLEGTVLAELPQQLFRLESAGRELIVSLSVEQKRLGLSIRTGQRVRFTKSKRDPSRGIIVGAC